MGGHRVTSPRGLGVRQGAAGGKRTPSPRPRVCGCLASWAVLSGPRAAYLVSRSGPERLGKRLEAAECRRHIAPRGGTPAAGLQGARSGGRSSGRPRWHRCRPGGTLGWPRRPHPRLQVPIRPLGAAASREREAERWRSAWGRAAQCRVRGPASLPHWASPCPRPPVFALAGLSPKEPWILNAPTPNTWQWQVRGRGGSGCQEGEFQ